MQKVQEEFEVWAQSKGLDTLALAPSDRFAEDRWYYEICTQMAYEAWLEVKSEANSYEKALRETEQELDRMKGYFSHNA